MARPRTLYLLAYNVVQTCGWTLSLSWILANTALTKSLDGAYSSAASLIGLTPGSVTPALLQWGGRTHFLFAIVRRIPEVQELPSVFITFTAWSISEVIRYSHYAMSCIDLCPSWLIYLRYTAFIALYPIGVFPGEMWLMYQALPLIKGEHLYEAFFSSFPFSYYAFVVALLVCYPFLWFNLYMYLFRQRHSRLRKTRRGRKEE
ncbi:uncharacterized protein LOC116255723 isoform X2 [Nymphaea colorata]|uniref:uncharacterized protein LOC116255723 isoform X2 n=1 Tax=Nymphaea colorata TaxID=210225 RepID=UPI00214EFDA3|nr:uncharacterized protein LOC116255723 isoform X2 [Nymphaea colorata]